VPEFGRKVPTLYATRTQVSRLKGQRSGSRDPLMLTHRGPCLPNAKAYELQTWYTDGRRRPASTTGAMASKVKSQGRKVT